MNSVLLSVLDLLQHDHAGRDRGAEEQVRRELDDGVDEVVVDQVLADLLLRAAAVEHAGELDDRCGAVHRKPAEDVHRERQVGSAFWGEHAGGGVARVVDQQRVRVASHLVEYGGLETIASNGSSSQCCGSVSVSPCAMSNFS